MMRVGISAISTTSIFSLNCVSKNKVAIGHRNITTEVAQKAIENYSNIFTQSENGIFIHVHFPVKFQGKRMNFVKLYMHANYLIGNTSIPLSDLARCCNESGYVGKKGKELKTGDLVKILLSKSNEGLFYFSKGEDNKPHVCLTDRGIQASQQVALCFNSITPESFQGRLKGILTIFIKEGWLKDNLPVSIEKLLKGCVNHGYNEKSSDLRKCVLFTSKQFFIFDKRKDAVKLSPLGVEMANSLQV